VSGGGGGVEGQGRSGGGKSSGVSGVLSCVVTCVVDVMATSVNIFGFK
jgi:hypothetical protein